MLQCSLNLKGVHDTTEDEMEQVETTDQYRERLAKLFETSYMCASDSDEEIARIHNVLKYKGGNLALYQYRRVTKENIYNLLSRRLTLTSPEKFNDIFDSFPYYSKLYFENSFLQLEATELRNLINIAREREFTQEEERRLGTEVAREVIKKLSKASDEVLENELFKNLEEHKRNGFEHFLSYAQNLIKHLQQNLRITCLCEQYDCPTMWGHYADSGRGFCLRYCVPPFYKADFCLEHACFSPSNPTCKRRGRLSLLPVIYSEKRFDCSKLVESRYNYYTSTILNVEPDYSKYDFLEYFKVSCFKSKSWQYEKEWRLILEGDLECPEYYNISALYPDAIYLGPQISKMDEAFLIQAALSLTTPRGGPLKIYKMSVDSRSDKYTLVAHEYSPEDGTFK